MGFEQAGFDVLAAVEYDPVHAAVHSYNFPHTRVLCGDVAKLPASTLVAAASDGWSQHGREGGFSGSPDVVFGGPPCQGFSTIGKRLIEDERNNLVFHFFRLVTELRPRYFLMENVPGMALGGHSSILRRLVEEFEGAGYRITQPIRVLQAAEYGVPQDRRRLFLIGSRTDVRAVDYPRPTVTPVAKRSDSPVKNGTQPSLDPSLVSPHGPSVWDAIGDLPDLDDFEMLRNTDEVRLTVTQRAKMERAASDYARMLRNPAADPTDLSYPRDWDPAILTSSLRTVHTSLSISRFSLTRSGETEPISRFFKLPKFGLCNTLRAGTGSERGAYTSPRPIHPIEARVISVREAARLHSFPDWFRFHQTKWHGFRQVGNSVPPLLGRAVATSIIRALELKLRRPERTVSLGDPKLLRLTMSQAAEQFSANEADMPKKRARVMTGRVA